MKRIVSVLIAAALFAGIGWSAYRAASPPEPELSHFIPSGALLYLQAKDFSTLLEDWDKSPEKKQWLMSGNYQVFSRSRLFLRLGDALKEFSAAAGVPADAQLVRQIAGKESAVAIFDIGKLQFLYITRISMGSAAQSPLWQARSKFETRSAGGVTFYLRRDADSDRVVAFATAGDYLLLATREDLMAGALERIAGSQRHAMEGEAWWSRSIAAAGAAADLRMVLNLEKIVPSPYFRSYWIQQNITDMSQYSAAISDLTRGDAEYREERILLRKEPVSVDDSKTAGQAAVADIVRLIPPNAGVYLAKANPKPEECWQLLETKILAPHLGPAAPEILAPQVQLGNGQTGSNSDLETRIDLAPVQQTVSGENGTLLKDLFAKNPALASLQVQSTEEHPQGVFVHLHTVVTFEGQADWNEQAVQAALADFVRPGLTTGDLGVSWKNSGGFSELNGLSPLAVAVHGKYLFVSDSGEYLAATLANLNHKVEGSPSVYAAGFNHRSEKGAFLTFVNMLNQESKAGSGGQEPDFFSENIGSLSQTLGRVASEKIVLRDAPEKQMQTVTYEWAP